MKNNEDAITITTGTENSFGAGAKHFQAVLEYCLRDRDELVAGTKNSHPWA